MLNKEIVMGIRLIHLGVGGARGVAGEAGGGAGRF